MNRLQAVLISVLVISLSCGVDQPVEDATDSENAIAAETEEYTLPEADFYMTVTDSIGIDFGDSNYMLGRVAGADILPDGRIAVLDPQIAAKSMHPITATIARPPHRCLT